jgi:hypothetical protein
MSQLYYSSWTTDQQDRFAAFRRCTFRKETISNLVTFCLAREQQRRRTLHQSASQLLLNSANNNNNNNSNKDLLVSSRKNQAITLQDFVAPHCASEITLVVTTIAKSYAQRLVTAARQLATHSYKYPPTHKLLPQFYLQAHRQRAQCGLDPGFFLKFPPSASVPEQSIPPNNPSYKNISYSNHTTHRNLYSLQLAAAQEAQKELDHFQAAPVEEEQDQNEETPSTNSFKE